jgi:hypothetical protein
MGLLVALRALHPVCKTSSRWSTPGRASCSRANVVEVADGAPIFEMQLRREIKLSRHAAETPGWVRGSAERLQAHGRMVC